MHARCSLDLRSIEYTTRSLPAAAVRRTVDPPRFLPISKTVPEVAFTARHSNAASLNPWRIMPRFRVTGKQPRQTFKTLIVVASHSFHDGDTSVSLRSAQLMNSLETSSTNFAINGPRQEFSCVK